LYGPSRGAVIELQYACHGNSAAAASGIYLASMLNNRRFRL